MEAQSAPVRQDVQRILSIPLEAMVVLAGKEMTLREVLSLRPGTIVEFEKSIMVPFDLMVNQCKIASGSAVKVGERFGIKISNVQPVEKTVKALGSK